jgi:hypothetical protein
VSGRGTTTQDTTGPHPARGRANSFMTGFAGKLGAVLLYRLLPIVLTALNRCGHSSNAVSIRFIAAPVSRHPK